MNTTVATLHPRTERRLSAARRVRDLLRSAIVTDELAAGSLPSETELMVTFSASRQVIRDALDLLRSEGLIRRLQGVGTLSTSTRVQHDFNFLHGPSPERIEHRVLSAELEVAPPRVAEKLGMTIGAECGVVEMVTLLEGEPLDAATTYVRADLLPLASRLMPAGEWFALYEEAGIGIGRTEHAIEATVADHVLAGFLEVSAGHPILLFERLVHDSALAPLEYAFTHIRGDRITLRQELGRHGP